MFVEPIYSRAPWPPDFPDVIVHCSEHERDAHPDYLAAKAGGSEAAFRLSRDLLNTDLVDKLKELVGDNPAQLASVSAAESTGYNAIPEAMAVELHRRMGLPLECGELRQSNRVFHTRTDAWHRFVTPAEFKGNVARAPYLLIDDHVGMGGTLANLRGYIEENGGRVLAMTTLSETRGARKIALTPATFDMLNCLHGQEFANFWREHIGYSLECCTELEGAYLCRKRSAQYIRRCLVKAAKRAREAGLSTAFLLPDQP